MLAEKLIEIHPWYQMVKFARTGGEANSIAIRIILEQQLGKITLQFVVIMDGMIGICQQI